MLARAAGRERAFSAALGFAYGLSGPMLSCWDLPFNLGTLAWLPWALWGLKTGRTAAAAVAMGLGFLAGEPVLWAALLPLVALFLWVERQRAAPALRAAMMALPATVGTALWLWLGFVDSARRLGGETAHAGLWARDWAVCLSGPVLGLPFREAAAPHDLYLPLPYLGMGLLAFAVHGLAVKGRHRWYLLPVVFFGLLAMGDRGPLGALMDLPVLSAVRFPARFLLLVPPCLALLALRAEGRRRSLLALQTVLVLGAWAAGRFHPLLLVPILAMGALAVMPWRSRGLTWVVLADLLLVGSPLCFPQRSAILEEAPAVRPGPLHRLYVPDESASFLRWVYPGGRFSPESDRRMLQSGTAYGNLLSRTPVTSTPHPLKDQGAVRLNAMAPQALGCSHRPELSPGGEAIQWIPLEGSLSVAEPLRSSPEYSGRGVAFTVTGAGPARCLLRFAGTRFVRVRVDGRPADWRRAGPWMEVAVGEGSHRVAVDFAPSAGVWAYRLSALCWAALLCYAIVEWKSRSRRSSD